MTTIGIIIADDHPIIRDAVITIFRNKVKWKILGEANNGIELLTLIKKTLPDIAIVDLEMPKMDGYETISKISALYPTIKTVAFSGFLNKINQQRAIKAGADATISKTGTRVDLITALEAVIRSEKYHSKEFPNFYTEPLETKHTLLTRREKQILSLIAKGETSKQISEFYNISHWTVDKHRSNIREKLGFKNLAEMVRYAIELS